MDFIKKHFEKILLAISLVVLIGVAAVLAWNLREEIREVTIHSRSREKSIERIDTSIYTNTIAGFESPSMWHSNQFDPFDTHPHAAVFASLPGPDLVAEPVTLVHINHKPFKLIWKAYSEVANGPTNDIKDIQINFLTQRFSFLGLKVGDAISNSYAPTPYFIMSFDKIITNYPNGLQPVDISRLTIQKPGKPPIVLTLNKTANESEPEAIVACASLSGGQPPGGMSPSGVRANYAQGMIVHKGSIFECNGKTYKVIDIEKAQVIIIEESTNAKHTLTLPDATK